MRRVIELRWDPILEEWVAVSNIREERPWRPSGCPFCPGSPETGSGWSVVVLENRFPMLVPEPPEPTSRRWPFIAVPGRGRCLVIVETPEHSLDDLSDLGVDGVLRVLERVRSVLEELSRDERVVYALWFRNKGEEVGVSLTHPHSQLYAMPVIPSKVLREMRSCYRYWLEKRRCLLCEVRDAELREGTRIVYRSTDFVAYVPFWARWPFEVHIHPLKHVQSVRGMDRGTLESLAECLTKVLCGLKNLFEKPMPYVMALHEPPLRGEYPWYHTHIEVYGMYRVSGRLKYAAGAELGGGVFTYDSTPERAAEMLRRCIESRC